MTYREYATRRRRLRGIRKMPRSDEEGLLAAIRDNPDDDTPRLAYADWLQEHGQDDRAEFIRLQCAAARLCEAGHACDGLGH